MRNADNIFAAAGRTPVTDLGTLWVLRRDDCLARCGLIALGDGWEVKVSVNGDPLLSQRCEFRHEVFGIAERWRVRLSERGWKKVTVAVRPRPDRRGTK
jgi:hypothetical protein